MTNKPNNISPMTWHQLLNPNRLGDDRPADEGREIRSDFQRDYDRIVFSTAFRRLQNKTQVFPLPETDFIHTRLTHSLEASCVGRSLGKVASMKIMQHFPKDFSDLQITSDDMAGIVSAACLAHDIGNPPFGHSGEDAISEYFLNNDSRIKKFTPKQQYDLTHFEGNANGFRVLTHTDPQRSKIRGGLQLTYSTLGAYSKYPVEANINLEDRSSASSKKYGFFQSDADVFEEVARQCGLLANAAAHGRLWKRHPLAFLVEAADDICYLIMDLEDGFKLKLLSYAETAEALSPLIQTDTATDRRMSRIHNDTDRMGYLRAKAINSLINQTAEVFLDHYSEIMSGVFDKPLTRIIQQAEALDFIRKTSIHRVYTHKPAVEIETAGFEIVDGLLHAFINAIFNTGSKRYTKFKQLLPQSLQHPKIETMDQQYLAIIKIVHYIAGMTDTHALNTYRIIKGISLPKY